MTETGTVLTAETGTPEEARMYEGAVGWRNLPDGRVVVLQPMLWGSLAIHLGPQDDGGFDAEWSYPLEHSPAALQALVEWDGNGDPCVGWTRSYPPYYRRRYPTGDPSEEYVAE